MHFKYETRPYIFRAVTSPDEKDQLMDKFTLLTGFILNNKQVSDVTFTIQRNSLYKNSAQ